MSKFTYELNKDVENEYVVYYNGELFCHLSSSDLDIFIDNINIEVSEVEK